MADNKLFYNVHEINSSAFMFDKNYEKSIGLVKPDPESHSHFGYIISGHQQYGASYQDIELIAKSKADNAYSTAKQYTDNQLTNYALKTEITDNDTKPHGTGSFTADGAEYTISFNNDGKISVSKYVAPTVSYVDLTQLSANKTEIGGGTFYVGYSYTINLGIDVTSTLQNIEVGFKNDTKQEFDIRINDGSDDLYTYHMPAGLLAPSITYDGAPVMSDVAGKTYTGVVKYGISYTASVSTSGEKTFTVFVDDHKTTNSLSKTQPKITASQTINPKTIFAYGDSEYNILRNSYILKSYTDSGITHSSSGDYTGANKPTSVTINAGDPTVIFHESLGTPTFKQLGAPDTSWKKLRDEHVSGVVNDSAGNGKIDAPAKYVIYQHTHTNGQGTWEITWAAK